MEIELPKAELRISRSIVTEPSRLTENETHPEAPGRRRRKKGDRLQGLKKAIEKSKAEKAAIELDLRDLMQVEKP
jgi:hypothetical protein